MKDKNHNRGNAKPPRYAQQFILFFLKRELAEEVLGDLDEQFYTVLQHKTLSAARRDYWFQTFNYLRPFAVKNLSSPSSNYSVMYKNYFKVGLRNLFRNKGFSLINIGGLTVGMAVAMLIGLWIHDEFSFNKSHDNYKQMAQFVQSQNKDGIKYTHEAVPFPLGNEIRNKYGSYFKHVVMSSWFNGYILGYEDKKLQKVGAYMEKDAPQLLSLKLLAGDENGLTSPNSIMISQSTAKAFFGLEDPIGKFMTIDNESAVAVTGVYEDFPFTSHFKNVHWLSTWDLYIAENSWIRAQQQNPNWNNNSFQCFAEIVESTNFKEVNQKVINAKYDNLDEASKYLKSEIILHPMRDWHLRANWENGINKGGFIQYVWLFGIIGLFVLILACINFMNLSTASAEKRAKEVGVRKSLGSLRSQLISQFLTESFLLVVLAFLFAVLIVFFTIPSFNQLADKQMSFPLLEPTFWLISLGFISLTGFLAGSYPALYLSSFEAVKVLKGTFLAKKSATSFRKMLVVLQFTVSVSLIIGTIVVNKQIQYSKNRPIGYDNNGVVIIEGLGNDYRNKYHVIKDELKKSGTVVEMAESSSPLTDIWNTLDGFSWEGMNANFKPYLATIWVTHDFGKTIGWEIKEGRDFSRDLRTDSTAFIINEAAAKYMNLPDPVGKVVRWEGGEHEIIGVVKDMIMISPFEAVNPAVYMISYFRNNNWMELKLNPERSTTEALATIEETMLIHAPDVPFEYKFADELYAQKFKTEERIRKLSSIFAILAIFISCLGLFGLASYMASQRKKEIGIRKVLGASVFNLWKLLSQEFVILVLVSCVLAIPIAYYGLNNWLANYEYRTEISWWFFALACLGALIITLLTVSYQSMKSALSNPVDSLKSE